MIKFENILKAFNVTTIIMLLAFSASASKYDVYLRFKLHNPNYFNKVMSQKDILLTDSTGIGEIEFNGTKWEFKNLDIDLNCKNIDASKRAVVCTSGISDNTSVSIVYKFKDWKNSNYVLIPSALYNGNKYESRKIRYSPKLLNPKDIGPDKPLVLSDVPRLNKDFGHSKAHFRSGGAATPSVSFYDYETKKGFLLFIPHKNELGDFGLSIEESNDKSEAEISIISPVVRETFKYKICNNSFPSDDVPANFKTGDTVTFTVCTKEFESDRLLGLFDEFVKYRKIYSDEDEYNCVLPFSEAFRIQEEKFNRDNWVDYKEEGYYAVGMRNHFAQDWQIGWVGGMITTYPLLFAGGNTSKERVIKNFNWLFPAGIAESGFFYGFCLNGDNFFGGDIRNPHTKDWHLTRKSADALFYIFIQLELMKKEGIPINPEWEEGIKRTCDAFLKVWQKNKQIGQFVDMFSGEIQVGGSTSAGILPAGLVYASYYFNEPKYLNAAKEIADYFYKEYTLKGISCGGPSDAMQNFDSESAYGLVEGYYALYEATAEKKWEKYAEDAAKQFATWVISYNYTFPKNSLFDKFEIKSVGGVWANTQNAHGSPGICTHSGLALLKLTRSTGNPFYANLLKDIAHAMPQLLSHPGREVMKGKSGWMNERLSTTDWNEGIGEIFVGSTWAETSLMLTYVQIPGLYVCADNSEFYCFDNVLTERVAETSGYLKIKISNPTSKDAKVKIWEESMSGRRNNIDNSYLLGTKEILCKAGESVVLKFKKNQ